MNDTHTSVSHPVIKVFTVWLATLGVTSWGDLAAALAALYSLLLILEWCWKKFGRPFAESRGWVKRAKRRKSDD